MCLDIRGQCASVKLKVVLDPPLSCFGHAIPILMLQDFTYPPRVVPLSYFDDCFYNIGLKLVYHLYDCFNIIYIVTPC